MVAVSLVADKGPNLFAGNVSIAMGVGPRPSTVSHAMEAESCRVGGAGSQWWTRHTEKGGEWLKAL